MDNTFSHLTPNAFLIVSMISAYIMTEAIPDVDEQLSFSNYLILVAFVMKNDAQQEQIILARKQAIERAKFQAFVLELSDALEELTSKVDNLQQSVLLREKKRTESDIKIENNMKKLMDDLDILKIEVNNIKIEQNRKKFNSKK